MFTLITYICCCIQFDLPWWLHVLFIFALFEGPAIVVKYRN